MASARHSSATSIIGVKSNAELYDKMFPPVRYLVDGLIPCDSISLTSGLSGTWKSWWTDYIGICVALGRPVLGRFETQKCNVLFIVLEGGEREHQRRMKALLKGASLPESFIRTMPMYHMNHPVTINRDTDFEELEFVVKELKPGLVIVDNIRLFVSGDENSSEFSRELQTRIFQLQAAQPSSWHLIHHGGKMTPLRGTSGLRDIADSHLLLERQRGGYASMKHEKARVGAQVETINIGFVGPEKPGGATFEKIQVEEDPWKKRVA